MSNRLALFAAGLTYLLIVFGGYVATSESGMGCGPDWPLCNGMLIPVLSGDTLIEFTHRVIGAILAIVSALLWLQIVRRYAPESALRRTARWMILLLVLQVLLGALVVILDLPSVMITLHLLVAMIFLALLIYIWRTQTPLGQPPPIKDNIRRATLIRHMNIILFLLLLTIGVGAYIKHEVYGLACGWLDCRDTWLPVTEAQILQTLHRTLAFGTTLYVFIVAFRVLARSLDSALRNRMSIAVVVIFAQLLIGVFTVFTHLDWSWAVLHLAAATALFAIVAELRFYLSMRAG